MTPESSPFVPGRTVPVEFFVGRTEEIERLRSMIRGASNGRFGIGKSSLAGFVPRLAEQEQQAAGCHVPLGGVSDLEGMLRTTLDRLLKDRVRKAGPFGATLELDLRADEVATLERNFAHLMRNLVASIADHSSLFLVLDDINGLAQSGRFANWLKNVVDEMSLSQEKTRLCLLLVDLEELRQQLVNHQLSLACVFKLTDIEPWSEEEAYQFYEKTFARGGASVSEDHVRMMLPWTGGLPVLAHEIGDAVWRTAPAKTVQRQDVNDGIRLAAAVIGRKFLAPRLLGAMPNERYLWILHKLTNLPSVLLPAATPHGDSLAPADFTKAEAIEQLSEDDKEVFDDFLRRMKKLGELESVPGVRGGYRFPNQLHLLYFTLASAHWAMSKLQWGHGGATPVG